MLKRVDEVLKSGVCFPRATLWARAGFCIFWLFAGVSGDARMVLEGLDGEVTTNELNAFVSFVNALPAPPSNNIGNTMVYESVGGAKLHGMQTFYSFTKDRGVLDVAVTWSDAFLKARNDPMTG